MVDIHEILETVIASPQGYTIATILRVAGSSYRKEGSMMVFGEDGTKVGMLSAGVLRKELYLYTKDLINEKWSIHEFDMREENDLSWGVGCNGIIYILLEKVNYIYQSIYEK